MIMAYQIVGTLVLIDNYSTSTGGQGRGDSPCSPGVIVMQPACHFPGQNRVLKKLLALVATVRCPDSSSCFFTPGYLCHPLYNHDFKDKMSGHALFNFTNKSLRSPCCFQGSVLPLLITTAPADSDICDLDTSTTETATTTTTTTMTAITTTTMAAITKTIKQKRTGW